MVSGGIDGDWDEWCVVGSGSFMRSVEPGGGSFMRSIEPGARPGARPRAGPGASGKSGGKIKIRI